MKIAVSAEKKDLNAQIDPRFGRCAFFIIVDSDDMRFEAFDNESISLSGGAGIQAAEFLASKGAEAIITGNVGPNAVRAFSAAGIKVVTGGTGTVRQAVDNYKEGRLTDTAQATVSDHFGTGGSRGGRGQGMGRRMGGRGMGRGMGGGGGRSR